MPEQAEHPAETVPQRRKGVRNKTRVNGRLNVSYREVTRDTTLERFRRGEATRQLRLALAPHQEVVKRLVAERLCHHVPTADLARELKLPQDQVKEILARMRPWVGRFTTYFEADWYWLDDGLPSLPDVPGK